MKRVVAVALFTSFVMRVSFADGNKDDGGSERGGHFGDQGLGLL